MDIFTNLTTRVVALRDRLGEVARTEDLPAAVAALDDAAIVEIITAVSGLTRTIEQIGLAATGVASARSTRAAGHSGLAQSLGHRSPVALIQHATGATRGEALRQVRVGESLLEAFDPGAGPVSAAGAGASGEVDRSVLPGETAGPRPELWHAPLRRALTAGEISSAQFDAIKKGLGEPPLPADAQPDALPAALTAAQSGDAQSGDASEASAAHTAAVREAWSQAATALLEEAEHSTTEELAKSARSLRDLLDPDGANARFMQRYEARSFRMWIDAEGQHRGSFVFDDESAAMLQSVIDAALRPRRGGPRFVDPNERARADALIADPRTNDQLSFDLMIDLFKAGALADAKTVLGAKQAGVRIVRVVPPAVDDATGAAFGAGTDFGAAAGNATGGASRGSAHCEDGLATIPTAIADQRICDSGTVTVDVAPNGDPLNLGREQRLYSSRQRIALSVRDGGCRWNGCDRPASYCESHHIDHWVADGGRTDIDRGLLFCRFHHLQLHNRGWKVTRHGLGPFMLHPPDGGDPIPLERRATLDYALAFADAFANALSPPGTGHGTGISTGLSTSIGKRRAA